MMKGSMKVEAGVNLVIYGGEITTVTADGLPPKLGVDPRIQGIRKWQREHRLPVTVAIIGETKRSGIVILNVGGAFKAGGTC